MGLVRAEHADMSPSYKLLYTLGAMAFIWLFLSLTPALWAPENWLWWMSFAIEGAGLYLPSAITDEYSGSQEGRCMSYADVNAAVSGPVDQVSGWYGPGAYLAWLVTAYAAAFSSIWHSKCAPKNKESAVLDGEILAALSYPVVALLDTVVRLIRCRMDPGINAAVFVLFSSLTILGPASRLSWQETVDGHQTTEFDDMILPPSRRSWAWKLCGFLIHGVIVSIIGEAYAYTTQLVVPLYVLLFALMLYSHIHGEVRMETYPYTRTVYRPRAERLAVFCLLQVIFGLVAYFKTGSFFPPSASRLMELDQAATFVSVVGVLLFLRGSEVVPLFAELRHRLAGFMPLRQGAQQVNETELQEIVIGGGSV